MKPVFLLAALLAMPMTACQPSHSDEADTPETAVDANETALDNDVGKKAIVVKSGIVRLRLKTPVSEEFACVIPIQLENGLESSTNVTMIGFQLTGPGDDASGNMFAPKAGAGEVTEARVIISGQSCDAFDTLSIPQIHCTSGEEDCAAKVELIDGGGLRFARTG